MLHLDANLTPLRFRLPYNYARGNDLSCTVLRVTLGAGGQTGRGEGSPFESFFDRPSAEALGEVRAVCDRLQAGQVTRRNLCDAMPAGPARNAVDAAMIDLEAKMSGRRAWDVLGLDAPTPVRTMFTISMSEPDQVKHELAAARAFDVLKLKLGSGDDDIQRLTFVHEQRPDACLVVDVNSGWSVNSLKRMMPHLRAAGVAMIEQPLPPGEDEALADFARTIPIFADESFSGRDDLGRMRRLYDGINVKLDKCGGLSEALRIIAEARSGGLDIMVGCLPGSSLSSAAGLLAAQSARFVDLDNQFWLDADEQPSLAFHEGRLHPPLAELWG